MPQRTVAISPSGLNNSSCIRKYKFAQIDRYRPRFRKNYMDKGSLIHRYLEEYYKGIAEGLNAGAARDRSEATVDPELLTYTNIPIEEGPFLKDVFRRYVAKFFNDNWVPLQVESIFSFVLYEDEELRILLEGRQDLIIEFPDNTGGKIRAVVDHKSRSRSQGGKVDGLNYAYPIYAMAANCNLVIDNEIGMQDKDPKDGRFRRTAISFSDLQLNERRENIIYTVKKLIHHIDQEYFPPNYTDCDKYFGCAFKKVCSSEPEEALRSFVLNTEFEIVEHDIMKEEVATS